MKKVVVGLFFLLFALAFFATPSFAFHGGFTENTKTCARCHSTHQSDAKNLLQADNVYQSCMACHDGTSGGDRRRVDRPADHALFLENSPNAEGFTQRISGTFGGTSTSMSAHLSEASVKISAAPGGATSPDAAGNWNNSFSCGSCHNAHGSYNKKYLNINVNGMASVPADKGGRKLVDVPVVTQLDNNSAEEFVFLNADGKLVLKRKLRISNKGVYTTYWVDDKSPWLSTTAKNASGATVTGLTVRGNLAKEPGGFVEGLVPNISGANISQVAKVDVERAYYIEVPTNKADYWKATNVVDGQTVPNMAGIQLSEFCAACHTDYLTHSGGSVSKHTGETYYGHTTDSASYTCVRCHYAHGTDVNLMIDAVGKSVFDLIAEGKTVQEAQQYMSDTNSALKKFTGNASCWACHNSSKSGNVIHDYKPVDERPTGMPAGR